LLARLAVALMVLCTSVTVQVFLKKPLELLVALKPDGSCNFLSRRLTEKCLNTRASRSKDLRRVASLGSFELTLISSGQSGYRTTGEPWPLQRSIFSDSTLGHPKRSIQNGQCGSKTCPQENQQCCGLARMLGLSGAYYFSRKDDLADRYGCCQMEIHDF
jgi:hypothetical protein